MLIAIFVFKLNSTKNELNEAKTSHKETMQVATKITDFKKVYAYAGAKDSLVRFLSSSLFAKAEIIKKEKKSSMKLSSNAIELKALNLLMGKILNSTYNIKSMTIKRLNDKKASFEVEILW